MKVKDFVIEDKVKAPAKETYTSEYTVLAKDGTGIVYRKKSSTRSEILAILPSEGQCYIKDEGTGKILDIRNCTVRNLTRFVNFFGDNPMDERPAWIHKPFLNGNDWRMLRAFLRDDYLRGFLQHELLVIPGDKEVSFYNIADLEELVNGKNLPFNILSEISEWLDDPSGYGKLIDKMIELEGKENVALEITRICLRMKNLHYYFQTDSSGWFGSLIVRLAAYQKSTCGGKKIPVDALISIMEKLFRYGIVMSDTEAHILLKVCGEIFNKITDWTQYLNWYVDEVLVNHGIVTGSYYVNSAYANIVYDTYKLEKEVFPRKNFVLMPEHLFEFSTDVSAVYQCMQNIRFGLNAPVDKSGEDMMYTEEYSKEMSDVMGGDFVKELKTKISPDYEIEATDMKTLGLSLYFLIQSGKARSGKAGINRILQFLLFPAIPVYAVPRYSVLLIKNKKSGEIVDGILLTNGKALLTNNGLVDIG